VHFCIRTGGRLAVMQFGPHAVLNCTSDGGRFAMVQKCTSVTATARPPEREETSSPSRGPAR